MAPVEFSITTRAASLTPNAAVAERCSRKIRVCEALQVKVEGSHVYSRPRAARSPRTKLLFNQPDKVGRLIRRMILPNSRRIAQEQLGSCTRRQQASLRKATDITAIALKRRIGIFPRVEAGRRLRQPSKENSFRKGKFACRLAKIGPRCSCRPDALIAII